MCRLGRLLKIYLVSQTEVTSLTRSPIFAAVSEHRFSFTLAAEAAEAISSPHTGRWQV